MMQELNYIRCGDYYIPDIRLPEENRPIGRWGRMHRDYIKEHNPIRFNDLCLIGELWTYLADLNEQAQSRLELIIEQMKAAEGVTEGMKQHDQMAWVGAMNSIRNRAEEWLSSLTIPEDDEIPCCYFSASDPYLKHDPLDPNRVARDISFDDDGNIHIKNTSAYWIPELTVTEEISGTIYTVTGSYEGEDSFIRKLERITSRKFTNQLGGHQ